MLLLNIASVLLRNYAGKKVENNEQSSRRRNRSNTMRAGDEARVVTYNARSDAV